MEELSAIARRDRAGGWEVAAYALIVVMLAGCGGTASLSSDGATADSKMTGAARDTNQADTVVENHQTTADSGAREAGVLEIVWSAAPTSTAGDGRLQTINKGGNGQGWDTCYSDPRFVRGTSPPEPTSGDAYLMSGQPDRDDAGRVDTLAEAYFWWTDHSPLRGLWFDTALVSGSAAGSTITFYETDVSCKVQRTIGAYAVGEFLTTLAQWRTGCIDLSAIGDLAQLGVRIDTPSGMIGLDSLRFGERCH